MRIPISTVCLEDVKELIASGDNSCRTQLRCSKDGYLFLHKDTGEATKIKELNFRFDYFDSHSYKVGKEAATNDKWVNDVYNAIIRWRDSESKVTFIEGYIS